jgi:type IV secretory pathway TrbF-like protein
MAHWRERHTCTPLQPEGYVAMDSAQATGQGSLGEIWMALSGFSYSSWRSSYSQLSRWVCEQDNYPSLFPVTS